MFKNYFLSYHACMKFCWVDELSMLFIFILTQKRTARLPPKKSRNSNASPRNAGALPLEFRANA